MFDLQAYCRIILILLSWTGTSNALFQVPKISGGQRSTPHWAMKLTGCDFGHGLPHRVVVKLKWVYALLPSAWGKYDEILILPYSYCPLLLLYNDYMLLWLINKMNMWIKLPPPSKISISMHSKIQCVLGFAVPRTSWEHSESPGVVE